MTPSALTDGSAAIEYLQNTVFAEKSRPPRFTGVTKLRPSLADDILIARMKAAKNGAAITKLLEGDTSAHGGDDSAADLALMNTLAFYTARNAEQMERIFSASALAHREKWRNRKDYRDRTIAAAIQSCREVYKPQRNDSLMDVARNLTDTGNAARFAIQHGDRLRYCHQRGQWLAWDGKRWRWDDSGQAVTLGKQTALSILDEMRVETDDARRGALSKWWMASQKRERISAMLALAQPELAISVAELDSDPWALNTLSGTVDVRTGELRPHRREAYLTKICRASYRPDATAPVLQGFLARIFRTHPALIDFIQCAIGYGGTGSTREQVLFFLYGTGANGKTTLIDAVLHALGDYGAKADPDLLMARDGSAAHPCNVADLAGTRFAVCSETNDGKRFDESRLKDLVGETRLKARFMHQNFFEFDATHKVYLYSNHKPVVRGTDLGFWRRMRLVPFIETIAPEERDHNLPSKLMGEADGILAWIVAGAVRWYREGLPTPPEVAAATAEYRSEMDSIGAFIAECCIEGAGMSVYSARLYSEYRRWAEENGEHARSQKRLANALAERGFTSMKCSKTDRRIWRGVSLRGLQSGGFRYSDPPSDRRDAPVTYN